jgi:hypothetical protein
MTICYKLAVNALYNVPYSMDAFTARQTCREVRPYISKSAMQAFSAIRNAFTIRRAKFVVQA